MPAVGGLVICYSSLHVFCGPGEDLCLGPLGGFVWDTAGVWGSWPIVAGNSIPVRMQGGGVNASS